MGWINLSPALRLKEIQWDPIDSYPSRFVTYASSLIIDKLFLEYYSSYYLAICIIYSISSFEIISAVIADP